MPQQQKTQAGAGWWVGRYKVITGIPDPSVAPGRKADVGTLYIRELAGSPQLWIKNDNTTDTNWVQILGAGTVTVVIGTSAAPVLATAGVTIPVASGAPITIMYLAGAGGVPQDMSATAPQFQAGTVNGQILKVIGTSNVATVKTANGNGLNQNGNLIYNANQTAEYVWEATSALWIEQFRRS